MTAPTQFTAGPLAIRLGVQPHHIDRLRKRGLIPFSKAGIFHVYAERDVPKIRKALIAAGYLPQQPAAAN